MADDVREVGREDFVPVYSRVSWAALFAGLFVALTVFLVLSALGAAIGLSVSDQVRGDTIATSAGIWALATALIAFFTGGCVTSRCTAGESRTEAVIYGTILWGLTMTLLLWMSGSIFRTGFTAVVGSAQAANINLNPNNLNVNQLPSNWVEAAQRAGLNQQQINSIQAELPTQQEVQARSAETAWWSFGGIVVSLLAAIGGAVTGAGPNPVFGGFLFNQRRVHVVSMGRPS